MEMHQRHHEASAAAAFPPTPTAASTRPDFRGLPSAPAIMTGSSWTAEGPADSYSLSLMEHKGLNICQQKLSFLHNNLVFIITVGE